MFDFLDFNAHYDSTVFVNGIKFMIDPDGYVTTEDVGMLGHLSECLEAGLNLHHIFGTCEEIDLDGYLKPQNIF